MSGEGFSLVVGVIIGMAFGILFGAAGTVDYHGIRDYDLMIEIAKAL